MNKTKLYTSNISYWVAIVFYYLGIHNDVLLRSDDYIFGVCNGLMLTGAQFYLFYSIYFFSKSMLVEHHRSVYPFVLCSMIGLFGLTLAPLVSYAGCDDVSLGFVITPPVKLYCQSYPFNYDTLWYVFSALSFCTSLLLASFYIQKELAENKNKSQEV